MFNSTLMCLQHIVIIGLTFIQDSLLVPFHRELLVFMQRWMARHTKGVAVKGINLGDVKEIPVPIPPNSALEKFFEIQELMKVTRSTLQAATAEANNLFNSLVQRAFRGEL